MIETREPAPVAAPVATSVEVRFAETDAMGVVHHGAYIIWFEVARIAWLEAAGVPYARVVQEGNHFAVTGISVQYRHSCRFGDRVRVLTTLAMLRSRQVAFDYEVRRADDNELLASGRSEHVCVDLEGRVARIPQAVMDRLQQVGL